MSSSRGSSRGGAKRAPDPVVVVDAAPRNADPNNNTKRDRPTVSLRLVIGILSAFTVLAVSFLTFGVTYATSRQSIDRVGSQYAASLVSTAKARIEGFFDIPASATIAVGREATRDGLYTLPIDDPTEWTVLEILGAHLLQAFLQLPDDYMAANMIFDDGSRAACNRNPDDNGASTVNVMLLSARTLNASTGCCGTSRQKTYYYSNLSTFASSRVSQPVTDARVGGYRILRTTISRPAAKNSGGWGQMSYNPVVSVPGYIFPFYYPLWNQTTFLGAVILSTSSARIDVFLREMRVTPNTVNFAVDTQGYIAASSHEHSYQSISKTSSPSFVPNAGCVNSAQAEANPPSGLFTVACREAAATFPYPPLQIAAQSLASTTLDPLAEPTLTKIHASGRVYLYAATGVSNVGAAFPLSLLLFMPETDILGDLVATRNLVIGVVIGIVVLASAASFATTTYVLGALQRVSKRMRATAQLQDVPDDVSMSGLVEIHDIQCAYRDMNVAIRSFTRYVPREVVKDLMATGDLCSLSMSTRRCTIQFTDIAGFTSMCERVPVDEMSNLVHQYFSVMTGVVLSHGGVVDKFIGDCVMAVWGAPFAIPNAEARATLCALQLQRATRVEPLATRFDVAGEVLNIRVGIATGDVLAGNMGSDERMNYTVIGDSVNLAARLESFNKQVGCNVLICQSTALRLRDAFCLRFLMRLRVVGKELAVKVYEVVGLSSGTISPEAAEDFRCEDARADESDSMSVVSGVSALSGGAAQPRHRVEPVTKLLEAATRFTNEPLIVSDDVATAAAVYSSAAVAYTNGRFSDALHILAQMKGPHFVAGKAAEMLNEACQTEIAAAGRGETFDGTMQAVGK